MEMQKENRNENKFRSRTSKDIHIIILPDECQTRAEGLIKLFGLTEVPFFTNIAEKEDAQYGNI